MNPRKKLKNYYNNAQSSFQALKKKNLNFKYMPNTLANLNDINEFNNKNKDKMVIVPVEALGATGTNTLSQGGTIKAQMYILNQKNQIEESTVYVKSGPMIEAAIKNQNPKVTQKEKQRLINLELLTEDFFQKELGFSVVKHSMLPIDNNRNLLISFAKDIEYPENAKALDGEEYRKAKRAVELVGIKDFNEANIGTHKGQKIFVDLGYDWRKQDNTYHKPVFEKITSVDLTEDDLNDGWKPWKSFNQNERQKIREMAITISAAGWKDYAFLQAKMLQEKDSNIINNQDAEKRRKIGQYMEECLSKANNQEDFISMVKIKILQNGSFQEKELANKFEKFFDYIKKTENIR